MQGKKKAAPSKKKKGASLPKLSFGGGASAGDALWFPNTQRPEWLDGSLPGE